MSKHYEDDALEDERREYGYAQFEHNRNSSPPVSKDNKIARYWKGYDRPDSTICDAVYIDRVTGREVMRYDAADPANTNPYYGARTDADCLYERGFNLREMIDTSEATISDSELQSRMSDYQDFEDDYYD